MGGSFFGFDFNPKLDFDIKNINIKKSFNDTIKSKSFKRFMTIIISLIIYVAILYVVFLLLDISIELKSIESVDGVEQLQATPVSPYLNNIVTGIVFILAPFGLIVIIASWLLRYKKIDDAYFNENKKTYQAKVVVFPTKKKITKSKLFFICVEILINDEDKENPFALVELPYFVGNEENTIITVEYLSESNEAKFVNSVNK